MKISVTCAQCGCSIMRERGHVNRSQRDGMRLFCGRDCAGVARRTGKTKAQFVAEKRAYDHARRRGPLREQLLQKKRDYHTRTYDPETARSYRAKRMHLHVEYCRRPEYRAKKAEYDQRHRDSKNFGEFAEVAMLLRDLEGEIGARMSKYEIGLANGTINKAQQRRRAHENPLGI